MMSVRRVAVLLGAVLPVFAATSDRGQERPVIDFWNQRIRAPICYNEDAPRLIVGESCGAPIWRSHAGTGMR